MDPENNEDTSGGQPDEEAGRLEAAYALADSMLSEDSEGEDVSADPDPPQDGDNEGGTGDEPEGDQAAEDDDEPKAPTTLAELRAVAAQRKTERETREAADAPARELAAIREELAALKADRGQPAKSTGIDPQLLRDDPMAALQAAGINPRDHLQSVTRQQLNPGVPQLERQITPQIQSMDERLKAIEQASAPNPEADTKRAQDAAKADFDAFVVDNAAKYPRLARLPQRQRIQWAWDVASESIQAGTQMRDPAIAAMIERELGPSEEEGTRAASSGDASGATRKGAPKSITNDLAAPSTKGPPRTEEERLAAAKQLWAQPTE